MTTPIAMFLLPKTTTLTLPLLRDLVREACQQPCDSRPMVVSAKDILDGHCFRKRQGTMVYIRMSEGSVKHLGLDPQLVYGLCHNGNTTTLTPDTPVVPMKFAGLMANIDEDRRWHRKAGMDYGEK